jgi:hypothetical protein
VLSQLSYPPVCKKLRVYVTPVNRIRPTMPRTMPSQPPGRLLEVPRADDVVAIEHAARLVPGDRYRDPLGHPRVDEVRTAVRRKSCRYAPRTPAALHASAQALRKSRMRSPPAVARDAERATARTYQPASSVVGAVHG